MREGRYRRRVLWGTLAATMALSVTSAEATFPGENGLIALACDGVCVVDPVTGEWEQLTKQRRGIDYDPSFSADGEWIVFSRWRYRTDRAGIFIMRSDGSQVTRLTNGPSHYEPAFSPDGEHIVFRAARDGFHIVRMNREGENRTRLGRGLAPSFRPDGARIVFTRRFSGGVRDDLRVFTMASDGSDVHPVTRDGASARYPSYSPDGSRIIMDYYDRDAGQYGAFTIAPDGSDLREVALSPPTPDFYVNEPVFSPDGNEIALMHIDKQWLEESCDCVFVATLKTDGTGLEHVLGGGGSPDWGPAAQG